MVSALKRLEILNKLKKKQATNKEAEECFEVAKTALAKTLKIIIERLVEHQELAKIALIIGDQKYLINK
jgi:predicted transcriptional regulator